MSKLPRRVLYGLILGLAISFLFGCAYEYYLWSPPSNDWGNEKTFANFLLVPAVIIIIVILLLGPLYRIVRLFVAIGWAGWLAVGAGFIALPAVELAPALPQLRLYVSELDREHKEMAGRLSQIAREIKEAKAVVVDGSPFGGGHESQDFVSRLAWFKRGPVYWQLTGGVLLQYQVVKCSGKHSSNTLIAGDDCLEADAVRDSQNWPADGVLLRLFKDLDHNPDYYMVLHGWGVHTYNSIWLTHFNAPAGAKGPAEGLGSALAPPSSGQTGAAAYGNAAASSRNVVWCNCGVIIHTPAEHADELMPYGGVLRNMRWEPCAALANPSDIEDAIFGPGPTFR